MNKTKGRTVICHFRTNTTKTENMLGEHLSKRKDKKKLVVILAITLLVLLAGILLFTIGV